MTAKALLLNLPASNISYIFSALSCLELESDSCWSFCRLARGTLGNITWKANATYVLLTGKWLARQLFFFINTWCTYMTLIYICTLQIYRARRKALAELCKIGNSSQCPEITSKADWIHWFSFDENKMYRRCLNLCCFEEIRGKDSLFYDVTHCGWVLKKKKVNFYFVCLYWCLIHF